MIAVLFDFSERICIPIIIVTFIRRIHLFTYSFLLAQPSSALMTPSHWRKEIESVRKDPISGLKLSEPPWVSLMLSFSLVPHEYTLAERPDPLCWLWITSRDKGLQEHEQEQEQEREHEQQLGWIR